MQQLIVCLKIRIDNRVSVGVCVRHKLGVSVYSVIT